MDVKTTIDVNDDFQESMTIEVDGQRVFFVTDGEPEDNVLNRNFGDVHNIPRLMKMAYEAGKKGEELNLTAQSAE